eukprot:gb/GECG01013426.1/.p1 GENE.gb/GECG01013426.1/~~gb/GECG01013426.1/.p1  ORF type:complete len:111 (+),score=5.41 gb/GECG01013426.1/:1-333(+)
MDPMDCCCMDLHLVFFAEKKANKECPEPKYLVPRPSTHVVEVLPTLEKSSVHTVYGTANKKFFVKISSFATQSCNMLVEEVGVILWSQNRTVALPREFAVKNSTRYVQSE